MYDYLMSNCRFIKIFTKLSAFTNFIWKQWLKGICAFLVILSLISLFSTHVGFVYSSTNSLPHHFFLHLKKVKPSRGHYTCFHSPWYEGKVIKEIVGMEGDQLSYNHSGNLQIQILDVSSRWLGRSFIISKSKTHSKDGRILTPIRPGFVPKGLVFVRGDHERSFDSRYEELGLIHEKDLQGRLIALV